MADTRRTDYLQYFIWINAIGLLIIAGIVIFGTFSILNNMSTISDEVQTKLTETNVLLVKLNENIVGLDQLNSNIASINSHIGNVEKSISSLPNTTMSISNVNTNLIEIRNDLNNLTQIYPPDQTLVFNDIDQNQLNNLINNAVEVEFNSVKVFIGITIAISLILSVGLSLGLSLYFIYKKEGEKP